MKTIIALFQILTSLGLIIFILLQTKGAGLGGAWGGSGEFYQSKRGVEKLIFYSTIILAALFLLVSGLGALFL